jgi:eukaryotic-like serine/threonine-protein kinase
VRGLLLRCLAKDPKQRLRDIGDAMSLVVGDDSPAAHGDATASASRARRWFGAIGWAAAGALALALALALWVRSAAVVDVERSAVKFQIERIADVYIRMTSAFAVSPDGRTLAYYGAGADGAQSLVVRTLATGEVRAVANSAIAAPSANSLFWSPDSKQLVRGAASGADVFDVTTGASRRLCLCRYVGGTWNDAGTILLGGFGDRSGISRLTLGDPQPVAITTPDARRGEQDTWPAFLPDGRRFLFTRMTRSGETTFVGTLDGQPPRRIADGSLRIIIPAPGNRDAHVLGVGAAGVVTQPFDLASASVIGPPVIVAAGAIAVSASQTGVLATSTAGIRPRTVPTWFDRKGSPLGSIGDAAAIEGLALSANGRKLLTSEQNPDATGSNIWLRDLVTGARTRVTFDGGSTPVWSPDGSRLAFTSARDGVLLPFQRAANGTGGDAPLFSYRGNAWANDWSRDGRRVIFSTPSTGNIGNDLWVAHIEGTNGGTPVPYLVGAGLQQQAQFSPDGRFVAYGSDQSGTFEIYVQPFPNAADGKWLVSNGGGVEPRWSRDGKELFYFSGQTLMAVPITLQPTFSTGTPVALFDAPIQPGYTSDSHRWQIAPDGTRFLLLAAAGNDPGAPLDVVVNWTALLQK